MKRVTLTLAKGFVCKLFIDKVEEIVEPGKEILFFEKLDFVKSFCYLGERLNASGKSTVVVTARTRIGCIKFRE